MRQKVAIFAAQRSGTHALASVLSRNGFQPMDELFLPECSGGGLAVQAHFRTWLATQNLTANQFILWPASHFKRYFEYLDTLTDGPYSVDVKYNGVRVMQNAYQEPSSPPPLLHIMQQANFLFIHLRRRNAFLRYVSDKVGGQTGQYHVFDEADVKSAQITIDIVDCLKRIGAHLKDIAIAAEWLSDIPHVSLDYETSFIDGVLTPEAAEKLASRGVHIHDTRPSTIKPDRDLRQTIANFDEVVEALNANGYGGMIENI